MNNEEYQRAILAQKEIDASEFKVTTCAGGFEIRKKGNCGSSYNFGTLEGVIGFIRGYERCKIDLELNK